MNRAECGETEEQEEDVRDAHRDAGLIEMRLEGGITGSSSRHGSVETAEIPLRPFVRSAPPRPCIVLVPGPAAHSPCPSSSTPPVFHPADRPVRSSAGRDSATVAASPFAVPTNQVPGHVHDPPDPGRPNGRVGVTPACPVDGHPHPQSFSPASHQNRIGDLSSGDAWRAMSRPESGALEKGKTLYIGFECGTDRTQNVSGAVDYLKNGGVLRESKSKRAKSDVIRKYFGRSTSDVAISTSKRRPKW